MEKMIKVHFNGVLNCGAFIYGAEVNVPENYTMNQLVTAIKNAGYKSFMTETMKRLANVN